MVARTLMSLFQCFHPWRENVGRQTPETELRRKTDRPLASSTAGQLDDRPPSPLRGRCGHQPLPLQAARDNYSDRACGQCVHRSGRHRRARAYDRPTDGRKSIFKNSTPRSRRSGQFQRDPKCFGPPSRRCYTGMLAIERVRPGKRSCTRTLLVAPETAAELCRRAETKRSPA